MAKIELKRFTNPVVLGRIQAQHLIRFFDRFKEELVAKNCRLPATDPGSEGYCNFWAGWLSRPESLPEAVVEAVQAMEEQVSPANWPRLEGAVIGARYAKMSFDTTCSPESLALQLWLWCPYRVGGDLAEVTARIEEGKKVWEEKAKVEREYQAREDARLQKAEEGGQRADDGGLRGDGQEKEKEKTKKRGAILPAVKIDSEPLLARYLMAHQINWIQAEEASHAQHKQAYALADKTGRIGL